LVDADAAVFAARLETASALAQKDRAMTSPHALTRRLAILALAAAALMTTAADAPYRYKPAEGDMTLGKATAPVTVIEYASVACPHCADWDMENFAAFKSKYIDTGRVRFVFREFLTADPQLAGAGFITARCASPDKYFDVVHDIMRQQADIYKGRELRGPLLAIAKRAGLTEEAWTACLNNDAMIAALNARSDRNAALDNVDSTPTFVVNGVKLGEDHSLPDPGKGDRERRSDSQTHRRHAGRQNRGARRQGCA
jgi:protein-disulfide isomerase